MCPMSPKLLRPRASGFNPRSISGLGAWFDASDSATMFDSNTGGSLITNNTGVGRWEDKSGNGLHATQSTSANRPVYKTSMINGLASLDFDGSNDNLLAPDSALLRTDSGISVFVVAQVTETGTNKPLAAKWSAAGPEWLLIARDFSSPNRANAAVRNAANTANLVTGQAAAGYNNGTTRLFAFHHNPSGDIELRVNGVLENSATSGASRNGTTQMAIGSYTDGGGTFIKAVIGEVLVYGAVLPIAQRIAVERYLRGKWGFA